MKKPSCKSCNDTGYLGPENVGTEKEPEVFYAECDMCDAPLNYDSFIAILNKHNRKLMENDA